MYKSRGGQKGGRGFVQMQRYGKQVRREDGVKRKGVRVGGRALATSILIMGDGWWAGP
jgi:hypothetical protein